MMSDTHVHFKNILSLAEHQSRQGYTEGSAEESPGNVLGRTYSSVVGVTNKLPHGIRERR